MDKQAILLLLATLIFSTIVWGGFSFYKAQNDIEINPKASIKSTPIQGSFELDVLMSNKELVDKQNYDIDDLKAIGAANPKLNVAPNTENVDEQVVDATATE